MLWGLPVTALVMLALVLGVLNSVGQIAQGVGVSGGLRKHKQAMETITDLRDAFLELIDELGRGTGAAVRRLRARQEADERRRVS